MTIINQRYLDDFWLHVYFDGLDQGSIKTTGAGVFSTDLTSYFAAGKLFDNFEGENDVIISLALGRIE
ncbi:hypothetical protein TNCV_983291 [Trichonephila clavipes]|nr:hypothetical protein TNCV_983291 [Trichonephila clavipes]